MPRWRIIIPVLIVAAVGVIAYMQIAPKQSTPSVSSDGQAIVEISERPLGVTGNEGISTQADVMVTELLRESDDEEVAEGDGSDEIADFTSGQSEVKIFDIEYYAE